MPRGFDTSNDPRRRPQKLGDAPHDFVPARDDPGHCAICDRYDTTHDEDIEFDNATDTGSDYEGDRYIGGVR